MKKKVRAVFIFMCFIFTYCAISSNAFALVCYLGTDRNAVHDQDHINVLAYLGDKGIGEKIWQSRVFSRDISCRSQLTGSRTENVYIYPFPKREAEKLPSGVKLGLIFNGRDLGTFDTNSSVNAGKVDTGWTVGNVLPAPSRTMTFQVYLIRTGEISTDDVYKLTIFQLDGVGGLNRVDENYNISITGWMNIGSVNCTGTAATDINLTGFQTDSIFKGQATQTAQNGLGVNVVCTSPNAEVLNYIRTVTTKLTPKGSRLTGSDKYFATNKENLGLALRMNGKDLLPDVGVETDVPFTSGSSAVKIPIEVTPHLTSLSLNQPAWLFSAEGAENITSSIPFTVDVQEVNTN
ncbi:hypothetical protein [Erwinia mallotivora]|uniref:hypothetical protein n=1 Tax=Erwinia mallotivora TaxID=69222 RepID=UPI0021C2270A|nr:hypothetical protein [Erwinia mallotivora]